MTHREWVSEFDGAYWSTRKIERKRHFQSKKPERKEIGTFGTGKRVFWCENRDFSPLQKIDSFRGSEDWQIQLWPYICELKNDYEKNLFQEYGLSGNIPHIFFDSGKLIAQK